jgi:hypothetical protein
VALVTRLSVGTKNFDLVTLTLVFGLLFENLNLGYIFLNGRFWGFDISHDKTFPWVPTGVTLHV